MCSVSARAIITHLPVSRVFASALASLLLAALPCASADLLPLGKIPPGKVVLVPQPHHDDHTTDYGMGGLIAKLVEAGYEGWYVRASNDEKDGRSGYAHDDMINLRESQAATRILGMKGVYSLSWRNDYMDPTPLQELREQLILLIRKHRPDLVLGHDPWAHYDRNPDHRKVARALAEAVWMAGLKRVHPEHRELGLDPWRVPRLFLKARWDYGRGHEANVAVELTESQVQKKQKAYVAHRNVYASPGMARNVRKQLDGEGLKVSELDGRTDQEAAVMIEEWYMNWISREYGRRNGVRYAEIYWFRDEFDHLPGLKDYITTNAEKK
jgi:LmbE family N-acetylglucosaminyl deacetylase